MKKLVMNILYAAYALTDWVRGKLLSAMIRVGLPDSK
jgi:hypothetical protein